MNIIIILQILILTKKNVSKLSESGTVDRRNKGRRRETMTRRIIKLEFFCISYPINIIEN